MWFPIKLLRNCTGASAAEYALILAIIGAGIAFAAVSLADSISNALGQTGTVIATCANLC
nr:hypothetical protein [Sphingomonas sp. URHD0057]